MSFQNSRVEALSFNVTLFGDRTCEEVIKVKRGYKDGPDALIERGRDPRDPSQLMLRRKAMGGRSSHLQARKRPLTITRTLSEPWCWTLQPPELQEINFCFVSHPVFPFYFANPSQSLGWDNSGMSLPLWFCSPRPGMKRPLPTDGLQIHALLAAVSLLFYFLTPTHVFFTFLFTLIFLWRSAFGVCLRRTRSILLAHPGLLNELIFVVYGWRIGAWAYRGDMEEELSFSLLYLYALFLKTHSK